MKAEFLFNILILTLFLFGGNYCFHYYFKKKREQLFKDLHDKEVEYIENVKTKIVGFSAFSFSNRIYTSDVILVNNNIVIILHNYFLLIKRNQSLLQLAINRKERKLNGVTSSLKFIKNIQVLNDKIKISLNDSRTITAEQSVELDFADRNIDIKHALTKKHIINQQNSFVS
ncbi:MAG: hypothetical protein V4511_06800 [Bacteroidota bacterium]